MADVVTMAGSAINRGLTLCKVLDKDHQLTDLHVALRSVRHELETAQDLLQRLGADIPAQRDGLVRADAPETSRAAARAMATKSGSQRHRLLTLLAEQGPQPDFRMQELTGFPGNSQRPRRIELTRAGYLSHLAPSPDSDPDLTRDGVVTMINPATGLSCEVWQLTGLGRIALRTLDSGQTALAFELASDV
jgi:hypothetical protein